MQKVTMKIFLVLGIIFFIVCLITAVNRMVFLSEATSSVGEVVNLIAKTSGGNDISYSPEVRFYTKEGETYIVRSDFSSDPPAFKIGEKVGVLYRDGHPDTAVIDSFFTLWFLPLLFLFLSLLFSAISVINILGIKKGLVLSKSYSIELSGKELMKRLKFK